MNFLPLLLLGLGLVICVNATQWSDSGAVRWAFNCDFNGNDLRSQRVSGEQCGPLCESVGECTHFSWSNYEGGTCWLKRGGISEGQEQQQTNAQNVCGYIRSRNSGGSSGGGNVKGTFWAEQSDAGGCQMPQADYEVTDAIALGQSGALGNLKWRQGLCGQVLRIDCGNGAVEAVVASTCNLNSDSCGVDMIRKTWNRATGNKPPGIVDCGVSLTNRNPIRGGGPLCYYRPNSETNNNYYAILGVVNTGGKISSSASVSGVSGRRNNDGWFEFNGSGQPLMTKEATVIFNFEDGTSSSFKLRDCRSGGQPQIFQ